jgi:hypothetical protein
MTHDGVPAFGLTNIPVMVNGNLVYSPAVNRVLQMAANIYDASTNSFYPSVFRPMFLVFNQNGLRNVYIDGYQQVTGVTGANDPQLTQLYNINALSLGYTAANYVNGVNIYGVPWIIGAKKFMPNFNQFYSYNTAQVSRKLQVARTKVEPYNIHTAGDFNTNQMLTLNITNHIGFSFWNSYAANYPGGTPSVVVNNSITMRLYQANSGYTYLTNYVMPQFAPPMTYWPGSGWGAGFNAGLAPANQSPNAGAFIFGTFDFPFIPECALNLDQSGNLLGFTTENFNPAITTLPPYPSLEVDTTNWFQGFILDKDRANAFHVIDYVQFAGPNQVHFLTNDMSDPTYPTYGLPYTGGTGPVALMWSINQNKGGLNYGVYDQLFVSKNNQDVPAAAQWVPVPNMPPGLNSPTAESEFFMSFFTTSNFVYGGSIYQNDNLVQQAPYTPVRYVVTPVVWVANDPLVHYLSTDLNMPVANLYADGSTYYDNVTSATFTPPLLGTNSIRFQPWGRSGQLSGQKNVDKNAYNLAYKDPLVYGPDNWDFPTNKYPTVGWVGRVHRGTPWQTVYLKATNILDYLDTGIPANGFVTWTNWTGNGSVFDAENARPVQDELLFDVFTAAPNDNATRGTLSVNQQHLAAWSAVFGGLLAISNASQTTFGYPSYLTTPLQTTWLINPAGPDELDSAIYQIVDGPWGIYTTRTNINLFPNGAFKHVGDILRTPALSQQSPFLNRADAYNSNDRIDADLSDEMYEWLPQQIMGLVRPSGTPRFVVYSYGQTLKPAPDGTVLSGGPSVFGLVTNYQVAAESATRAIVTVQQTVTNTPSGPVTNYNTKVENFNVLPPP